MDNTTIKLECINTSNLEVITECDKLKEEYKETSETSSSSNTKEY